MPDQRLTRTRTPHLVLVGSFGAGNVGDELILAGFLQRLKRDIPQARIIVLTGDVYASGKWHSARASTFLPMLPTGLRSLFSLRWLRSVAALRRCDAVLFPGGGLFTDEESWRASVIWALHIFVARFVWKDVYLFGQSVGPFRTAFGRWLAGMALRAVTLVAVRDRASRAELRQLGLHAKQIQLGEDSALFLACRRKKTTKKVPKKILISARRYPQGEGTCFAQLRVELAKYPKAELHFAEFGTGDRQAWDALGRPGELVAIPTRAEKVLDWLREYDLVVGMRLHSLIAAYVAGVPAVGVGYSRKVRAFCTRVGIPMVQKIR